MKIKTTSNIHRASKVIHAIDRQMRYAARLAINDVMFEIKKEHPMYVQSIFQGPVSLTKRAPKIEKVSHHRSWAEIQGTIFLEDHISGGVAPGRYLRAEWKSGDRADKASEKKLQQAIVTTKKWGSQQVLPPGYQTVVHRDFQNAKGNITKGRIQKIMADLRAFHDPAQNRADGVAGRYFVIHPSWNIKGMKPGIYLRQGKRLKIVLIFVPRKSIYYRKKYDFEGWVEKKAVRKLPLKFKPRLAMAMKTARL